MVALFVVVTGLIHVICVNYAQTLAILISRIRRSLNAFHMAVHLALFLIIGLAQLDPSRCSYPMLT